MKDVSSEEPATYSIVHSQDVVDGFTREQSAEKVQAALDKWVVALAKRWAREDHINANHDPLSR